MEKYKEMSQTDINSCCGKIYLKKNYIKILLENLIVNCTCDLLW